MAGPHGALSFHHFWRGGFGREKLERVSTGPDRKKGFAGREVAWRGNQPCLHSGFDDLSICGGRDDDFAAVTCHATRSVEHTSELTSLIRISYAVLFLKQNTTS